MQQNCLIAFCLVTLTACSGSMDPSDMNRFSSALDELAYQMNPDASARHTRPALGVQDSPDGAGQYFAPIPFYQDSENFQAYSTHCAGQIVDDTGKQQTCRRVQAMIYEAQHSADAAVHMGMQTSPPPETPTPPATTALPEPTVQLSPSPEMEAPSTEAALPEAETQLSPSRAIEMPQSEAALPEAETQSSPSREIEMPQTEAALPEAETQPSLPQEIEMPTPPQPSQSSGE